MPENTDGPVIPSSVRADGTIRKERRVRPGYIPSEQVPKYMPPAQLRLLHEQALEKQQKLEEGEENQDKQETPAENSVKAQNSPSPCIKKAWEAVSTNNNTIASTIPGTLASNGQSTSSIDKKSQDSRVSAKGIYIPPHLRKKTQQNNDTVLGSKQPNKHTFPLFEKQMADGSIKDGINKETSQEIIKALEGLKLGTTSNSKKSNRSNKFNKSNKPNINNK